MVMNWDNFHRIYLFSLEMAEKDSLDQGIISQLLHEGFSNHNISLSNNASTRIKIPDDEWEVVDSDTIWIIRKEEPYLFSSDKKNFLNEGKISKLLQKEFKNHEISLSKNTIVNMVKKDEQWKLTDNAGRWLIKKEGQMLYIYKEPKLHVYRNRNTEEDLCEKFTVELLEWARRYFFNKERKDSQDPSDHSKADRMKDFEDLAQELCIKMRVEKAYLTYKQGNHVKFWMYTIAKRMYIDYLRSRKKKLANSEEAENSPQKKDKKPDIFKINNHEVIFDDAVQYAQDCLNVLSNLEKEIFFSFDIDEISAKEIQSRLDYSPRQQLNIRTIAKKKLEECIDKKVHARYQKV